MDSNNEFPKRKSTRLKGFDYSTTGAYFVTICIKDRNQILSEIVKAPVTPTAEVVNPAVGEGLAPPETPAKVAPTAEATTPVVGEGLAPPEYLVQLKPCGEVAKEQLQLLENRFPNIAVEDFVMMPDHIHAIIFLHEKAGGASPSPTLDDVICAFKSLTSHICKQRYGIEKMFQRSYAEHIVRDREDYETRKKYIYENPMRWYYKHSDAKE